MIKPGDKNIELFKPECLTINLGSGCNLGCSYCFVKEKQIFKKLKNVSEQKQFIRAVESAARVVIKNCQEKKQPFFFGFLGDGEPLVQFELVQEIYNICRKLFEEQPVSSFLARSPQDPELLSFFSFITSNGTLEEHKYRWVARNFRRVCLSVDGPEWIHDQNRRFSDGTPTLKQIKNTLSVLRAEGCYPVCRTTVTPQHTQYLSEIVQFLGEELDFRFIQIEPVYHLNNKPEAFSAKEFAENLLMARTVAREMGSDIIYSGYRPDEIHGPYCNILKNVLSMTPDLKALTCGFDRPNSKYSEIGAYDPKQDFWVLNQERIADIKEKLALYPEVCKECSVVEHCVRGCPDFCILDCDIKQEVADCSTLIDKPRCQINRALYEKGW